MAGHRGRAQIGPSSTRGQVRAHEWASDAAHAVVACTSSAQRSPQTHLKNQPPPGTALKLLVPQSAHGPVREAPLHPHHA
jgi:hypothetical protein